MSSDTALVSVSSNEAADDRRLLTRCDLQDTLYVKAFVGALAGLVGAWLLQHPATMSGATAAMVISTLCLTESGVAWWRLSRRWEEDETE